MVTRRQRWKNYRRKRRVYIGSIIISLCIILSGMYITMSRTSVPVSASMTLQQGDNLHVRWPQWRDILFLGIPGLESTAGKQQTVKVSTELNAHNILRSTILLLANVDIKDIRTLISSEIPFLATLKTGTPTVNAMSLPNFPKFDTAGLIDGGKPLVGVYHTHTAESFIPTSGVSHRPGGQRGDIVEVGSALIKQLEKHGIKSVHNTNIHDYPSFMKAYGSSEITVKNMLSDYPSIQMLFDIHRDADKRENVTATVNGVQVAKILFVVATGQQDLVQPHWQENHAFAKLIDAKLNQHYPGVSRGIQLVEWRYNQHLHPRALLLEVGCQENSREEAERTMEMLGDVLAEIIAENSQQ